MKTMMPLNVKVHEYQDLEESIQKRVISKLIEEWIEFREYNNEHKSNFEKAIDNAEKMKTPWFAGEYIYEYCREDLEKDASEYFYDKNGERIPVIYKDDKLHLCITKSLEIEIEMLDF